MEQIKELKELVEFLNTKQYTKLRQYLAELNDAFNKPAEETGAE